MCINYCGHLLKKGTSWLRSKCGGVIVVDEPLWLMSNCLWLAWKVTEGSGREEGMVGMVIAMGEGGDGSCIGSCIGLVEIEMVSFDVEMDGVIVVVVVDGRGICYIRVGYGSCSSVDDVGSGDSVGSCGHYGWCWRIM